MSKEVMEYIVYMIHACAKKWRKSPKTVYGILNAANCIELYLTPHFDVLHTQSTECVVEDIEQYVGFKGDKA